MHGVLPMPLALQPIALAASFDRQLVQDVASAIGDELRAKSNAAEQQGLGPRWGWVGLEPSCGARGTCEGPWEMPLRDPGSPLSRCCCTTPPHPRTCTCPAG